MPTQLAVKNTFSLTPTTFDEAMKFSGMLAKSSFCPKQFQGKPEDVLIAIQMGAELGLQPMQALQNIAVINGRPSIWGDAALAIVQASGDLEDIDEGVKDGIASCTVKRKGRSPHTVTFSEEDAKKAKLWGKQGPWSDYPKRMLQMRARGFALRNTFADALKGLIFREEAQDFPEEKIINPVPARDYSHLHQAVKQVKETVAQAYGIEPEEKDVLSDFSLIAAYQEEIAEITSLSQLMDWANKIKTLSLNEEQREEFKKLYVAKKNELEEGELKKKNLIEPEPSKI